MTPSDHQPPDEPAESASSEPIPLDPGEPSLVQGPEGMLPTRRHRRHRVERGAMRLVATCGILGIATGLGAILVSQDVAGWIVGLAVGLTTVLLSALLWSSREL